MTTGRYVKGFLYGKQIKTDGGVALATWKYQFETRYSIQRELGEDDPFARGVLDALNKEENLQ